MTIAQHLSKTAERYTPAVVAEKAHTLMGGIDLDPASSWLANRAIRAKKYFGTGERNGELVFVDGFYNKWAGRVFLNPPGGRAPKGNPAGTQSNATMWWWRLANAWKSGAVTQAVFVGFTMELLRTAQHVDAPQPMTFPMCVPRDRMCFATPSEVDEFDRPVLGAERVESNDPTHGNVIIYLPPHDGHRHVRVRRTTGAAHMFKRIFEDLGEVRV